MCKTGPAQGFDSVFGFSLPSIQQIVDLNGSDLVIHCLSKVVFFRTLPIHLCMMCMSIIVSLLDPTVCIHPTISSIYLILPPYIAVFPI